MYDNICKYLAENFQADLATWLLGSPVELTELSPTELSNEPIRADALILLQSENLILHIEFQTDGNKTHIPHPKMLQREITEMKIKGSIKTNR
jgi:predicted transposase YdaD